MSTYHVAPYPVTPEHVTKGFGCWCQPEVSMICEECADRRDNDREGASDCWRCEGRGLVECPDPAAYDGPYGLVVVHHDGKSE